MGSGGIAQVAIGQWRDHLSYKKGISITQSSDVVYCATESGIFSFEKNRKEITPLSKITGLSDVEVSCLRYNLSEKTLLIAYKNANIDLIAGKNIYNLSDIKRKLITAKKTINNIYFINQFAYLACGFGIVVVDMDKKEISDTYYIGTNSGYINVRDITSDANYIYAASDSGVFRASLGSPNLADYNSWQRITKKGSYNTIAAFANKIFVNLSQPTLPWGNDSLFQFDGTQWTPFLSKFYPINKLETGQGKLFIANKGGTDMYDSTLAFIARINAYNNVDSYDAIAELSNKDVVWIADHNNGLVKCYQIFNNDIYVPTGPGTSKVYDLKFSGEELWVAPGDRSELWIGTYNFAETYKFSKETWTGITGPANGGSIAALDSMRDVVVVAIDPADKEHIWLATLGEGIAEIKNGALVNVWNETNTGGALQSRGDANFHWVGSFGMNYDSLGNLWITNCYANNPLVVRKADGTWQNFSFSGLVTTPTIGQILITQSKQKWMVLPRNGGFLAFDDNGTWTTSDDRKAHLTFPDCVSPASGSSSDIPTDAVCIAEDKDGAIWAGTDKGIIVFFCPDQVFSSGSCKAQQIFIQQDGHTQILLETEIVTAIAVDGANRKWIGTQNSGVFLMSADGTKQLKHFTVDNSPLLSNEIRSIAIQPKTGEIFFGTIDGIISYRSDATEGLQDFTNVYVFPNPVQPGYEGPIAITGLIENAIVKITDITGTLVYQTKALGGQAIWYGKNFKGEKAHSGVYLAFCANEDGSKTFIAKILLVN